MPYRALARVEVVEKPVCGLLKPTIIPKHECSKPGWLDRLFRVESETLWRCGICREVWRWVEHGDTDKNGYLQTANVLFGEWKKAYLDDWIKAGGAKE